MIRNDVKIVLYVIALALTCIFGTLAVSSYKRVTSQSSENPSTNALSRAAATNVVGTNATETAATETNAVETAATETVGQPKAEGERTSSGYGRLLVHGAVFFVAVVGLGLLVGHDVSHYLASRMLKGGYGEEAESITDPEYELAEQEWANGHHLEAINMMREYLNKHPREQHVALRIAEIYEKDLFNPLAAALEYEEVLKCKLPAERWGWAAIHLCNLYSKLGQQDKVVVLLRRIDAEYGSTAAAEKARKRLEDLGLPLAAEATAEEAEPTQPPPPSSGPKLPPGFTLKKS
jgi:hypothetical protein